MKRVLVVDDEPVIRTLVTASLESGECTVVAVGDGPSALESVENGRPDLILLDVALPGMSGRDVARRLKADRRTASIPILYLTGLDAGPCLYAEGVIAKPFTPASLRACAADWLR